MAMSAYMYKKIARIKKQKQEYESKMGPFGEGRLVNNPDNEVYINQDSLIHSENDKENISGICQ